MVRDTDIKGYMDFGSVDITLLDVNDNKPTFITVQKVVYFNISLWQLKIGLNSIV